MTIDSNALALATADLLRMAAVVPVDVKTTPNGQTSGCALLVSLVGQDGVAAGTSTTPLVTTTQPVQTNATAPAATTITVGSTAQVLFASNTARKGWAIQNQSSGDLYVRSRGTLGTTDATLDQNSLKIPGGAYYETPYVTNNALSIIGATTGQAFWAREW